MAKNGNVSVIMKESLLNLFKYANPILNTALGFKATGSRLCIWLWTLSNDSASQHTPVCSWIRYHVIHVTNHVTSVCFWQLMWEVVCLWAVPRCNLGTCTPTTPVYHWLIWQLEFTDLDKCWLWAIWGVLNDELIMSCIITWFLSMRVWGGRATSQPHQ